MTASTLRGVAVGYLAVTGSALVTMGEPVPARPRSTIRPLRVLRFSDLLSVRAVQGVGYRVVCTCEYRGKVRRTVDAARADKRQHDAEHDREREN